MELVAHRAANLTSTIAPAAAVATVLELDVHLFRERLEVRHAKVIWPFARLWERWELLPRNAPRPELAEILDASDDSTHLWIDLKGFTTRLTYRVADRVGDRRPLTASSQNWWTLRPLRRARDVRVLRSVGSRWQLWLVKRMKFPTTRDGVVIHERLISRESMESLHLVTSMVFVWAIEDLGRALELADLGVTGLIVDDLTLIAEIDRRVNDAEVPGPHE